MDDILAVGEKPLEVLTRLNPFFTLRQDSLHPPDNYLGAKLKKTTLPNGVEAWGQSSSHYVHNVVKDLEEWMVERKYRLPARAATPMMTGYQPELDVTDVLDAKTASYYQSLIEYYDGLSRSVGLISRPKSRC
jgi:hypothetical protein